MKNRSLLQSAIVFSLLAAILACNFSAPESNTSRSATQEALGTSVAQTATATANVAAATPEVQQVQSTATQVALSIESTQVVQATGAAIDLSATQAVLSPILGELPLYGVDPQQGHLGWIQPPLRLEIDQYRGSKFDNKFPTVIAKDFVLSSDITWDTEYGGSGCGYVFRADGNQAKPNQYMVVATRLANGHVFFAVMAQGELIVGKDFYANGLDPKFNASNGATNHLTVVGRGTTFSIYSNGTKLGDADPNAPLPALKLPDPPARPFNNPDPNALAAYQRALAEYNQQVRQLKAEYSRRLKLWKEADKDFESGFTSLGVVADSGRTICEFNNAWLWLMDEP
jgi:hypothetical protein